MLLQHLQRQIEELYELKTSLDVVDFLVRGAGASVGAAAIPEKLLIHQGSDELEVGLYLEPDLLRRLEAADPTRCLHDGNLSDFWTVLEGVSHFVYFAWNAGFDREVSLLELEVQAEVDKYVLAALLLMKQLQGRVPPELHGRLFANPRFHEELDGREVQRYIQANEYAARYCRFLEEQMRTGSGRQILNHLRRFYRLSHRRKLRAIDQLAAQ